MDARMAVHRDEARLIVRDAGKSSAAEPWEGNHAVGLDGALRRDIELSRREGNWSRVSVEVYSTDLEKLAYRVARL
jgi:hypothetical protein